MSTRIGNRRVSSNKQRKQQHLLDVRVRSRKATAQRNRKLLAWLSAAVLFTASVGGAWYGSRQALRRFFWQNPDYNLAEIEIHTDGPLTRDQILQVTALRKGVNIFSVDLTAAHKNLAALPQVDHAELNRVLPNRITIEVTERKPVAWVAAKPDEDPSTDADSFMIDRAGILLRTRSQLSDYLHLPVIYGVPVGNYEAGQTVDAPEVKAALDLIRITGENPARYQVRSIDVSKGYCLVVTDEHHAKVTFPLDNLQAEIEGRLFPVMQDAESKNLEIQTVNLLVERNTPVTFVPPPETDAAAPDASPAPSPVAEDTEAKAVAKKPASTVKKTMVKRAQPVHKNGYVYHGDREDSHPVRRARPVSSNDSTQ